MSDENRNVNVKLTIDVDKSAPKMFQAFTNQFNKGNKEISAEMDKTARKQAADFKQYQEKLYKASGTAGQLGFGQFGQSMAGNTNFAAGLDRLGMSGAAGAVQGSAGALAIAAQSAKLAQFAADSHYDKYSTDNQKGRGFVREFVPGGAKVQGFVDSLTGRAAKMEEADIEGERNTARGSIRNQQAAFQLGWNPRQAGAEALSKAYQGQSAVLPSVFDRSTGMGERSYREEQRIIPLKQAQAKAERDVAVSTAERLASEKELGKLTKTGLELTTQRAKLEVSLSANENQSGASRQRVLRDIESVNSELSGNLNSQKQAREQVLAATQKQTQAKGEAKKAALRTELLGKADVLESRADQASTTATAIGAMNPYERQFAVESLKNLRNYGPDVLPPEALQAAMSIGGETARKLVEKAGAGTAAYDDLTKSFPELAPGNPNDLRKQADKLRQEYAQGEFNVDKGVAEGIAASGRNFGGQVGDIINQTLDVALSEIRKKVLLGRNQK